MCFLSAARDRDYAVVDCFTTHRAPFILISNGQERRRILSYLILLKSIKMWILFMTRNYIIIIECSMNTRHNAIEKPPIFSRIFSFCFTDAMFTIARHALYSQIPSPLQFFFFLILHDYKNIKNIIIENNNNKKKISKSHLTRR